MVPDILLKGLGVSYLAFSSGMAMIHNYISSPEDQILIREYSATPRGKQTALNILPMVLDTVELPHEVKESVRENLGMKNEHFRTDLFRNPQIVFFYGNIFFNTVICKIPGIYIVNFRNFAAVF